MAAPLHERIRDAVAADVKTLGTSPVWTRTLAMELWEPKAAVLPCICVSYEGGEEQFRGGSNERDYIGYPVLIAMHGVGPINTPEDRQGITPIEFRDRIRARYHNKRIAAIPECDNCEFVPNPILNLELPQYEKLTTAVALIVVCSVPRAYTGS
ncbi:MAG: hypothetical protein JNK93_07520 [Planctomycetia bacterium]|nr:hypothetical protein [Planctomycetia bacterium]